MNNILKRLIAILVAFILLASNVVIISQAASDYWDALLNSPTLNDMKDGEFCEFRVSPAASAVSKEAHNLLNQSVVIKNMKLAAGNSWGFLGFSTVKEKPKYQFFNNIDNGTMGIFFRNRTQGGFSVLMNESLSKVCDIPAAEVYTFSFKEIEGKYCLVINDVVCKNNYIDNFIRTHGEAVYVKLFAENSMKGSIKVDSLDWEYPEGLTNLPNIYYDITGSINTKLGAESVVNTIEKIDWNTNVLEIEDAVFSEGEYWTSIALNKVDKQGGMIASTENGDIVNLILKKQEDGSINLDIYDGELKNIGNIPEAYVYKLAFAKKDDAYGLYINDVLFTDEKFNSFMTSDATDSAEAGKSYVVISAENSFEAKMIVSKPDWQQNKNDTGAKIEKLDDGFTSISLNVLQSAITPRKYNLLNNEIVIKNIEKISGENYAVVDLVKETKKNGPSVASKNIISLVLKKNGDNFDLSAIDSTGAWRKIISFAATEECVIRIVNSFDRYYYSINGKLCRNISTKAQDDLQAFVGTDSACMSYVNFTCTSSAKADIKIARYTPPLPTGLLVYSNSENYQADGDDENGYTVNKDTEVYSIFAEGFDPTEKSLQANVSDVEGYLWFSLSKSNKKGEVLETGTAAEIDRVVFKITPNAEKTEAQLSHWNASGEGEDTVIATIPFDWTVEHTYDVRFGSDEQWYIAIDGKLISGANSTVLNSFMNANKDSELHYGIGGNNGFAASILKIVDQIAGDDTVDATGWKYWSSNGSGFFEGDNENGYSALNPSGDIFAFTVDKWDITKKSLSIDIDSIGGWFAFFISTTGALDTKALVGGSAADVNRIAFIITPTNSEKTMARISYYNAKGRPVESIIDTKNFDWDGVHTFDVRKGSDGHWYICVDNVLISGTTSEVLDEFMTIHQDEKMRFGVGGTSGKFEAKSIKVIDQGPANLTVNTQGWRYWSSIGSGNFSGNDEEGYNQLLESGDLYSISKIKYDVEKTAISFKLDEIRSWLWFAVSAKDSTNTEVLAKGQAADISRVVFIITPKLGFTEAQVSYWNADGNGGEKVITTLSDFNWYGEHTFDIREDEEEGHWFICIDGKILMKQSSSVFDEFMCENDE